jgi:hypothetical protein
MFTKLSNQIRRWLHKPVFEYSQLVIFDGDQTNCDTFTRLYQSPPTQTKYAWVSASTIPKVVQHSKLVEILKTSSYGKEAVDTLIALVIYDTLVKYPHIKKVFIVSADGDFLDTIINLARYWPDVKFGLVNDQTRATSLKSKSAQRTLSDTYPNCSVTKIKRYPQLKKVTQK